MCVCVHVCVSLCAQNIVHALTFCNCVHTHTIPYTGCLLAGASVCENLIFLCFLRFCV